MLKKVICHFFLLLYGLFHCIHATAQQGFYIPKSGKVFFKSDTATIFSNVLNQGMIGVGKEAVVNFHGQVWENDQQALITDESDNGYGVTGLGGLIRFYHNNVRQKLVGGYNAVSRSGPMFSSLQVENSFGLDLDMSSTKVGYELIFSKGHVYLNNNLFVMGNKDPGVIRGYDSTRFFVTGNQTNGGILLRENIKRADGQIVFPVGSAADAYTPAAIRSRTSRGDDFYVGVSDGVRSNLFTGDNLKDETVNKTWQIGKVFRPNEDDIDVFLQHLTKDEGGKFALNRRHTYISKYSGTYWDQGFPQNTPGAGNLNDGNVQVNSGINNRTFLGAISGTSYFTKFAGNGDTALRTQLLFGASRVNSSIVRVNWQTRPGINIHYFIVERRLSNESSFKPVDTVLSAAINGASFNILSYGIDDLNSDKGVSFYRLKIVGYNDPSYYSKIVAVNGVGFYKVLLWPNPTPNQFYLIVNAPAAKSIVIFNNLGQKMWSQRLTESGQTFIEVKDHRLMPGSYFVSILDTKGSILETEKLIILGK